MATPITLQTGFARMVQDLPRDALPKDACWNMRDWIPDYQAHLRKRGGWTYGCAAPAGASSAAYVIQYGNFSTGPQITFVDGGSKLWAVSATASAATTTAASIAGSSGMPFPTQTFMHRDKVIFPGAGGAIQPRYYDGTTVASISAAPAGDYGTVYHDRSVLRAATALSATNATYVYFSAAGDPLTWDLTNSWISVSRIPTGFAALPSALLVFMSDRTARVRGSIPPPGSDFTIDDPLFNLGCTDARSIAVRGDYAIFANTIGIYRTNGSFLPEDLTLGAGLKKYWNDLMAGFMTDPGGFTKLMLIGGIYRNHYYIVVMNGETFVDAFAFDLDEGGAHRLSNFPVTGFVQSTDVQEELFFGVRSSARIGRLSSIWSPAAANKADGNGTAVTPLLETPFFLDQRSGKKTWRGIYVEYDMRDAASDDPTLTVSVSKTPDGSYTTLSPTLPEVTDYKFTRLPLRFPADGLGVKIQQTNASSETKLAGLLADVHVRESSRLN